MNIKYIYSDDNVIVLETQKLKKQITHMQVIIYFVYMLMHIIQPYTTQ